MRKSFKITSGVFKLITALFIAAVSFASAGCLPSNLGKKFDPEPGLGLGIGMFVDIPDVHADGLCRRDGRRITFEQCRPGQ